MKTPPFRRVAAAILVFAAFGGMLSTARAAIHQGLVAYYDFEGVGAAGLANKAGVVGSDYSGTFIDATIVGTGITTNFAGNAAFNSTAGAGGTTNRASLIVGNTANFSGVAASRINTTIGTAQLGQSMTIGMWFYSAIDPDTAAARRYLFEGVDNFDISLGTGANATSANTTLSMLGYFNQNGANTIAPSVSSWHHVVHTIQDNGDGTSTLTTYLDGASPVATTSSNTTNSAFVLNGINIGNNRNTPGRPWDGMIDEVVLYNRAISPGEVGQLYDRGIAGQIVPEPSTLALLGIGALGLLVLNRRRARHA